MKKNYLVGYKLVFALLGISAIITEVVALVERDIFNLANFASFFTVQSNVLAIIAFLMSAFFVFAGKKSAKLDFFRGAVTFYMIVTGIVFAVLLAGLDGVQLTTVPWDNTVLHYLIPIAIAADWLIDPPAVRIGFRRAFAWISFPIAYLAYSLIRGAIVGWYPYPFLNPANGGYGRVVMTCALITVGGLLLIYIVSRFGAKAKKKRA